MGRLRDDFVDFFVLISFLSTGLSRVKVHR